MPLLDGPRFAFRWIGSNCRLVGVVAWRSAVLATLLWIGSSLEELADYGGYVSDGATHDLLERANSHLERVADELRLIRKYGVQ